ncbi:unnamed protein product [Trichobilharzia szidati]|nr:unnamed protein product [Trichobilharzia szidati]
MKKVALVTVIGLPGSGKSTLCGHLCNLKTDECLVIWIEYDKLIPSEIFSQNSDNSYWKNWRQAVLNCTERLLASWRNTDFVQVSSEEEKVIWLNLSEYSTLNVEKIIVLLDDNFYYSSMRRVFYSLAKKFTHQ